jgi:hypothetical protein
MSSKPLWRLNSLAEDAKCRKNENLGMRSKRLELSLPNLLSFMKHLPNYSLHDKFKYLLGSIHNRDLKSAQWCAMWWHESHLRPAGRILFYNSLV